MAENLPLIPEKETALCGDVKTVLRDVFRELDYLPPLVSEPLTRRSQEEDEQVLQSQQWIKELSSECKELYIQEEELKQEFAKRLAREPLPNIYKLQSPAEQVEMKWKKSRGMIGRRDLRPTIEMDAGRDNSLWVRNILNRSSGDLSKKVTREISKHFSPKLNHPAEGSLQSISMGEPISHISPPPSLLVLPPPEPECVICIPPQLNFVNFYVGHDHTQSIRLVNITKFEVRLSIRPPTRPELSVELCSRLAISSGASATLLLHYRPKDVMGLTDELLVRVSVGKKILLPICCYMEPPLMDILIPNVSSPRTSSVEDCYNVTDLLDLGAKLVGELHRSQLVLYCGSSRSAFYLLSDDNWINYKVDIPTAGDADTVGVVSECFWVTPVHWCGGGTVNGLAVCRASSPGVHTTVFRIVSSTAIVRAIHMVADALMCQPDHITLQAHEKNYDICSPDDSACEYYVNLGTAFPNRPLVGRVHIINHSSLTYEYYWSSRRWGVCSCVDRSQSSENMEEEQEPCPGAIRLTPEDEEGFASYANVRAVHPEPAGGRLSPRTTNLMEVRVPDVGKKLGIQRAVLMLVLKNIPIDSLLCPSEAMIVKTKIIEEESIPGLSSTWKREVCDIVCAQMEVWWEVTPVCFVVDQPLIILPRSRRIKCATLPLHATQVTGTYGVLAHWRDSALPQLHLSPGQSVLTRIHLPFTNLPDEHPEKKTLQLVAANDEWSVTIRIVSGCSTRHPELRPALRWLGVVPPGARVQTTLTLKNDTLQHIYWWGSSWRWYHENPVSRACEGEAPCAECRERTCSCALLRPTRGALDQGQSVVLHYDVYAPETDGCVATLIQVRRTAPDLAQLPVGVGSEGRASLVAYRVLAPKLTLRVLPCLGDKHGSCEACTLDEAASPLRGTAVLRPSGVLTVGRCACYRLKCTNLTPLPTTLRWEPPIDGDDVLKVTFIPNDIEVGANAVAEITAVVKPLKVCERRIFTHRASIEYSHTPLYLLIDAGVQGLEVTIEVPLGGDELTDTSIIMRRSQTEESTSKLNLKKMLTAKECFEEEDRKREIRTENICHCRYKMVYIPPKKPLLPPKASDDECHVEIVTEPPPLTRVCPCTSCSKPVILDLQESLCLQFQNLPIRTVRSRIITIRNLSTLTAKWTTAVRRWPRTYMKTLAADKWAANVRDPGIAVHCSPSQGVMTSRSHAEIPVSVYADCWGLYHDQILIHIENIEPIVLDLWVEVVGLPLSFAIQPDLDTPPVLWMTSSDPDRTLYVTNTTRADLVVHTFVMQEHGHSQNTLPFRLYLRFYDIPPRTCPCCDIKSERDGLSCSSEFIEMDTAIEVFLAADYGQQCEDYYKVEPVETILPRGCNGSWRVQLLPASAETPDSVLLLRTTPVQKAGDNWYRPTPAPQRVSLRAASRSTRLQLSCAKLRVPYCALDLPYDDVMRIRKPFQVHNTGNGHLSTSVFTAPPWRVVVPRGGCHANCPEVTVQRPDVYELDMPPRSMLELCVEVSLHTRDLWPSPGDTYPSQYITTTPLTFFDENHVMLASMQLVLELDYPVIQVQPPCLDFDYVTDGDTKKNYVEITHSSSTATIELVARLEGSQDFEVQPHTLRLLPATTATVFVQYCARWSSSPADGVLHISAAGGGSRWCTASVPLHARPTRDRGHRAPPHHYTDPAHLAAHHVTY